MPTYEYKCRACGHRFEVVQSFSDEPLRKCTECGGELGKVFGNIGITFKGSGFYKTDSRSSSVATKPNGKDKSESKSEAKADSKSESKSETKSSEAKPAKAESKTGTSKAATSKGGDKK
jgi:putative FmdB family regulatory protein